MVWKGSNGRRVGSYVLDGGNGLYRERGRVIGGRGRVYNERGGWEGSGL